MDHIFSNCQETLKVIHKHGNQNEGMQTSFTYSEKRERDKGGEETLNLFTKSQRISQQRTTGGTMRDREFNDSQRKGTSDVRERTRFAVRK